ncbi:hypothetical protein C8Q77DRAFT_1159042 [Trametes polyzona]|nr:hypothetical protein C8Q77DRAFT_1159042 [Trametes polyzona]
MSTQHLLSHISVFYHSSYFPTPVWEALEREPRSSNIIYAHAREMNIIDSRASTAARTHSPDLWIVCWASGPTPNMEFILSCTSGPLGDYPVFLYSPLPSETLISEFIYPRMRLIIDALHINVPPERVFSVFALDPVADVFAALWTSTVGIRLAPFPTYYHAKLMCCDKTTFENGQTDNASDVLGTSWAASDADLLEVARLCGDFSATSAPFVLSPDRALKEATHLIRDGNAWVHTLQGPNDVSVIACIVAATRNTDTVSAITKVYTDPQWRSRGYAERLVRYVCNFLLQEKKSVVLYVSHSNPARKVYERVGFVGFADSWKELGFERSAVEIGHW